MLTSDAKKGPYAVLFIVMLTQLTDLSHTGSGT